MISHGDYKLKDPDSIPTPAMLVFEDIVDQNIRALCDLSGAANVCPHVKTHKSVAVTRKQMAAGITVIKCATLRELEMVLEAGVCDAVLAYPLIQKTKLQRFAAIVRDNPHAAVHAIVGLVEHVHGLAEVAAQTGQTVNVMLDLDAGFHRTGVEPGARAMELYRLADADANLTAAGLHVYDGHDHATDLDEREQQAMAHIGDVKRLRDEMLATGMPVPRIVGGGSFSFPYYAREEGMLGSPGTSVYWDYGYASMMPDMPFRYAAAVLTQVVDLHPKQGTATTDLGTKAVSAEIPTDKRARFLGYDDARLVSQSEEHGVFTFPGKCPAIGDYLYAIPGHVCPTTIRYPGSHVVNPDGDITDFWAHTARDR